MAKMCGKYGYAPKVIFHTELDAKIALAGRVRRDKGEKRIYKCEFGNHYHLTSQESRADREAVR